jgi:hypothetical protein
MVVGYSMDRRSTEPLDLADSTLIDHQCFDFARKEYFLDQNQIDVAGQMLAL